MTAPNSVGPATTAEAALAAYYQWDQSRTTFLNEVRRAATDVAPRLDEYVAAHRTNSSDQDVAGNITSTADWMAYLDQLYQALEAEWTALLAQSASFTPQEIAYGTTLRTQYQAVYSNVYMVLYGLNLFFWNVSNERDALRTASAQAVSDYERATADGSPNALPLPDAWLNGSLLQTVDNQTLATVIVSGAGQAQSVNVTAADVTGVRQLAA